MQGEREKGERGGKQDEKIAICGMWERQKERKQEENDNNNVTLRFAFLKLNSLKS